MASAMDPAAYAYLPHDDVGPKVLAAIWSLTSLAAVFLGLRIYCKFWRHRGLWWDDYILIAAWLALLVDVSLTTVAIQHGMGKHIWDAAATFTPQIGLISLVISTVSVCSAVWSKTSFAVTILRLVSEPRQRTIIWAIIWSMNILMGISALVLWIQCNPIAKGWEPSLPGSCWDPTIGVVIGIIGGVYSGLMDLTLALLPWKIIMGIQTRRREKIGIAFAMSMGVFAAAMAFVKSAKLPSIGAGDFTYAIADLCIWGAAETSTTIMAACIPVLRPLFIEAGQQHASFIRRSRYHKSHSKGEELEMGSSTRGSRLRNKIHSGSQAVNTVTIAGGGATKGPNSSSQTSILGEVTQDGRIMVRKDAEVKVIHFSESSDELRS